MSMREKTSSAFKARLALDCHELPEVMSPEDVNHTSNSYELA